MGKMMEVPEGRPSCLENPGELKPFSEADCDNLCHLYGDRAFEFPHSATPFTSSKIP